MRPALVLSDYSSYTSSPIHDDPWTLDCDGSPTSSSPSSSRPSSTSSSYSHVLPESAFTANINGGLQYVVDPYFGQQDVAHLCSSYLTKAFRCNEETDKSISLRQPKLPIFVAQVIHITGAPLKVVMAALILLQRFRTLLPQHCQESYSGHSLFMGGLMLACSDPHLQVMVSGNAGSAAYWSEISLFSESELDDIFNNLYDELDGNIVVFPSYAAALEKLNNPISTKSFEIELDFFSSDAHDSGQQSPSGSVSSIISMPAPKAATPNEKKNRKADSTTTTTKISSLTGRNPASKGHEPPSFVKAKITSLFSRKTNVSKS